MSSCRRMNLFNKSGIKRCSGLSKPQKKSNLKKIILLFCFAICLQSALAQNANPEINTIPKGNGRIIGVVIDSVLNTPVEFANVAIIDPNTQKPFDGTVCDEKGKFVLTKVPKGNYELVISFIGFESRKIT